MAEKNTKPVHGPGGRGPKGPRPKVENPGRLFMRLLAYIMKNYAVHCILVVICIFITVLASVQGTWFMQTLIDSYILPLIGQADPDFSGLLHAIMRVAVFYLIGAIASYIYTRIMVNVSQGTLKNLRDDMFTHMEELPIRYFDTHYHGDIMSTYTNDIDTLRQMISQSMPQFLNSIITIVSVFVSMLLLNIPLTIVTLLMIGVTLFATKKIGSLSAKYFIAQQKDIATVNGYIEEMMNGQKVVKVFTHEEESIENFNRLNDQLFHSADNANKFGNILMPVNAQIGNISYVLCALVGGVLALNGVGGFTLGKLASFLTYNKSFSQPVNQLSMQLNNIVMALAGSERIFKLLDEEPEVDNGYVTLVRARKENGQIVESKERTGMWAWKHTHQADGSVDYIELKGDVVFDDVNFGYNPDKIVLHNVDLYATPGQKIAFVGSTGAGKTTMVDLILGVLKPQAGKITVDGMDIKESYRGWHDKIGYIPQTIYMLDDTIRNNIAFGKVKSIDDAEIWAALKQAQLDEFVKSLDEGLDTMIGEAGVRLSGGQRQRIGIARALYRRPEVLVLDEATSALDTETEAAVMEAIDSLQGKMTMLIIAHRLSTIKNCDMVYQVEGGSVTRKEKESV